MINRIFFVTDNPEMYGHSLPEVENVYYSILVDPSDSVGLANAYETINRLTHIQLSLTLLIRKQPTPELIKAIGSFLFIGSYLRIDSRPVISVTGPSSNDINNIAASLSDWFSTQGFTNVLINHFLSGDNGHSGVMADSSEKGISIYQHLLTVNIYGSGNICIAVSNINELGSTIKLLQQEDEKFNQNSPELYLLIQNNFSLQKETDYLKRKTAALGKELEHHKQYEAVLRSQHSSRELQDYYDREYEVLPKWYKQFGHVLKVLMGKRTFNSLFRNDVKKHKD